MATNHLLVGPPRSGKTTVVKRVVRRLETNGYRVGGVYSPERRRDGERVGFDIVDVATGESRTLAAVDRQEGPRVGKYRVDVAAVDAVSATVFQRAVGAADVVVVDEIAPMQLHSDRFVEGVRGALDADAPVLAAVHESAGGVVETVKARADTERHEVTTGTRETLPATLADRFRRALS